jgi:hypothetical protein
MIVLPLRNQPVMQRTVSGESGISPRSPVSAAPPGELGLASSGIAPNPSRPGPALAREPGRPDADRMNPARTVAPHVQDAGEVELAHIGGDLGAVAIPLLVEPGCGEVESVDWCHESARYFKPCHRAAQQQGEGE